MPHYRAYLERSDLRIDRAAGGPRLHVGSSHYKLWRVWGWFWRWEATFSEDAVADRAIARGLRLGKEPARAAARTWLQRRKSANAPVEVPAPATDCEPNTWVAPPAGPRSGPYVAAGSEFAVAGVVVASI